MKGFISIDLPTKPYIKAYVHHKLGPHPKMIQNKDSISAKIYDLLQHKTDENASEGISNLNTVKLRLYIPVGIFRQRGGNLNVTNVRNLNQFIEQEIKDKFYFAMDRDMEVYPNFIQNLPAIRRLLGIDIEAWSDDSMKKDYYRYRLRKKNMKPAA